MMPKLTKSTSDAYNLDEAVDIARAAVACKKNKQYNLARMYFTESAKRMTTMCQENRIAPEKQPSIKEVIQSSIKQLQECVELFKTEVQNLKKDQYCNEIMKNIVETPDLVGFDTISIDLFTIPISLLVGLDKAKNILKETLILPNLRPDLFTGLRSPPRGILFYGPPGNGKTYLAKAVSKECNATFINISASVMVSKWMGEGEKMMRALFQVANVYQPCVIFIDEIDSMLAERKENDHESSRRLKTEFLIQFDGLNNSPTDRISLIGATNLPNYLDPAALRRFGKRILIPLPDEAARAQIVGKLLCQVKHALSDKDIMKFAKTLEYYSASDIANLVKEAAMEPLRHYSCVQVSGLSKHEIRAVTVKDLENAKQSVLPSLTKKDVTFFVDWEKKFGASDR